MKTNTKKGKERKKEVKSCIAIVKKKKRNQKWSRSVPQKWQMKEAPPNCTPIRRKVCKMKLGEKTLRAMIRSFEKSEKEK